jgi:foldase protein PrsA
VPTTLRRSPLLTGVLVLLVAAVAVGVSACGSDSADLPAGVVARVGDADITQAQLDRLITLGTAQAKANGQTLPAKGQAGFDAVERQALQQLVLDKAYAFEARECGQPCKVTSKDIDADIQRIIASRFNGDRKKFDAYLKANGYSQAEARDAIKSGLQREKLFNHVTRGVRFTEADAKAYYQQHPDEFRTPAGRDASHILVHTKAEAEQIRAEVTPENFAEIAREKSTDTATAKNGGELGPVQKGQFVPEFEKAALALKDGEISQPVKTIFGWHIIKVKITPAKTTSFADAKDGIISSQLAQKRQAAYSKWESGVLAKWSGRTVYADSSLKPSTQAATTSP